MSSSGPEHFWAGRFGKSFEFVPVEHVSTGNWPSISQTTYSWTIGILAGFTLIIGAIRILLRLKINGRLDFHDGLFAFALCCSTGSAIFNVFCASYFYIQAELSIGLVRFANSDDILPAIVQYLQILYSVSAVQWIAIYSVKLCYLMFFNTLTSRLRGLRIWWWVVVCSSVPCLICSCLIGLYLCHDFGPDVLLKCPIPDMGIRGRLMNKLNGAMDIATDLMIISIPIILITKVKIDLKRKIAIGAILSLSAVMIATSFVRLFPPTLRIIASDGPWYIFWEAFETSIANLMVSITSFKSIYGGINGSSSSKKTSSNLLSGVKPSLSSRMSRFFLRTSESSSSTTQNFEALLPTSTTKGIQDSQDFEWKTSRYYSPDEEKSFHTNVSPHIRIREQIDIEVSRQSRLDLSPVSSNTFSPPSIQLDQQSKSLWNMIGKY